MSWHKSNETNRPTAGHLNFNSRRIIEVDHSGWTKASSGSSTPSFDIITMEELENPDSCEIPTTRKSDLATIREIFGPELTLQQLPKLLEVVDRSDLLFTFEEARNFTGGKVSL